MSTVTATLLLVVLAAAPSLAAEKTVHRKDLPPGVQKTVDEQSRGATIRGFSRETEGGKTYFEAELNVNGHTKDVLMDPDGRIVEVEEEIPLDSLPAAVRSEFQKQAGRHRVVSVESITKGGAIVAYEAHIRKGLKTSEVKLSPEGKPVP